MHDDRHVIGWDIGGAHVKACRRQDGAVVDVAQWACPLWQGMDRLEHVLQLAGERWPRLGTARHAITMTGEMADLFEHREDGVRRIAALLAERLGARDRVQFFAGDAGWCGSGDVARHWQDIASANWLAAARHAALCHRTPGGEGLLIDIGSTTTDLIAFRAGRVLTASRTDAQRLATGELVYHGVVRTPLCAVAPRIAWRGTPHNVMNEVFATTADVYRLTGELNPLHDLHPAADNGAKDPAATRRRLARMAGLDERDGTPEDWLAFAGAWRSAQMAELASQLQRVMALHALSADMAVVSAGCGSFLVADVVTRAIAPAAARPCTAYGSGVARLATRVPDDLAAWAQVCAPSVAVAALLDEELR